MALKALFLGLFVHVCFVQTALLRNELFPLDIIHYNDFHDRFEETAVSDPVCKTNDARCIGGFARLVFEIKALLKEKPGALLLNAGDNFQGTYWYRKLKWNVTQHFLNMLPHDAHTIGNHEFDDGIEGLVPFLAALQAPVLVANIDISKEPTLAGLYIPKIVLERKGKKIGIIGVTTTESAKKSKARDLIFLDPVQVVKKEAQSLADAGVDIILVLSHCGLLVDKEIAKHAGELVDIIVGGHSHSLLWNGPAPSNETVNGAYPEIVYSKLKPDHKVLIVQSGAFTKYLGNITLYFDKHGELVAYDGQPVFLNRSVPEDLEIKALLKPYTEELHHVVEEVVGTCDEELLHDLCNFQECAVGNFVADAMLNATKESFPSDLPNVGMLVRNMIRGPLPKVITRGSVWNLGPYGNVVTSVVTTGRVVLQALNQCLTNYYRNPFNSDWMPQVSGMQVTINGTIPEVISVLVDHKGSRLPLEMDKDYQLTLVDFLYLGGNGFSMIKPNAREVHFVGVDDAVLERYIKLRTPITNHIDNRLVIVE